MIKRIELCQVDRPGKSVTFAAPPLTHGADLRAWIAKGDRRPEGSSPLVLRVYDDNALGFVLLRDEDRCVMKDRRRCLLPR